MFVLLPSPAGQRKEVFMEDWGLFRRSRRSELMQAGQGNGAKIGSLRQLSWG